MGCVLRDPIHLDVMGADLEVVDFHDPYHGRMWATMLRLRSIGAVNVRTLAADLRSDPAWEDSGGENYLDSLRLSATVNPTIPDYIRILKDLTARRILVDVGKGLIEDAYLKPSERPTEAISGEAMESLLLLGAEACRPSQSPHTVAGALLEKAHAHLRGEKPSAVTTGSKKLDRAIGGGLQAEDFMGIAARSGMAKTSLLRKIGLSAARAGAPALFFSKEMSAGQLTQGMLTDIDFDLKSKDEAGIEGWKFRAGCLSNYELTRLEAARGVLDGLPLEICDDADLTMGGLTARARAFQSRHKGQLGIILVDFLQIVTDDTASRTDSREQIVSRLAYGHKRLAKLLGWPVVAAIQLKNKGDGKTPRDSLPTADDVRESGAIEMAADILVAPHRQAFFHKLKEPTVPHDRPEYVTWSEKMKEIENDLWLRGFKNRHGDPSALNLELWCNLGTGSIRDERPHKAKIWGEHAEEEELRF